MTRIFATAATAALLAAGAAFGQATQTEQPAEVTWESHTESMATLSDSVQSEFSRRGIEHPVGALTLDQLSEIFLVFNNDSLTDDEANAQVDRIIEGN